MAAFLVSAGVQIGGYFTLLATALGEAEADTRGAALRRWLVFIVVWQVLVLAAIAAYAIPLAMRHPRGLAWLAPPLGAVVGTALPLQLAVARILRALRY